MRGYHLWLTGAAGMLLNYAFEIGDNALLAAGAIGLAAGMVKIVFFEKH